MSVELLSECKRKLTGSITRLEKILDMYDSTPLERCLQETCKAEAVIRETKETMGRQRMEYQKSALKYESIDIE
jgi:hypothetical protein